MKFIVGSVNPTKVGAVVDALRRYPSFEDFEVFSVSVPSGISEQPKSLDETVQGAMNRAIAAFKDCDVKVCDTLSTRNLFTTTNFCATKSIKDFVCIQKSTRETQRFFDYSFGIESGLMRVPHTLTGSMDFCACVIHDGRRNYIGLSSAFEFPPVITKMIHEQGVTATDAARLCGLTNSPNIGYGEGIVGLLTNGIVTRKDYTMQAIHMALLQVTNPGIYLKE